MPLKSYHFETKRVSRLKNSIILPASEVVVLVRFVKYNSMTLPGFHSGSHFRFRLTNE